MDCRPGFRRRCLFIAAVAMLSLTGCATTQTNPFSRLLGTPADAPETPSYSPPKTAPISTAKNSATRESHTIMAEREPRTSCHTGGG